MSTVYRLDSSIHDLNGSRAAPCSGAVSELTVRIVSHCPQAAALFYEQAMVTTTGDRLDSTIYDLNGLRPL